MHATAARQTRRLARRVVTPRRRGYVLPAVLLFLVFAFGTWAVFHRGSASIIRTEQARVQRDARDNYTASATAAGLRLLQTGNPPSDPYSCKIAVTVDDDTRYTQMTFASTPDGRWSLHTLPTDADDNLPDAPDTFFTVPAAPTGLAATPVSAMQIDLAWNDVAFDNGYQLERALLPTGPWTQVGSTAKNVTSISDTGLLPLVTYYYRVRGVNDAGNGGYSNIANATTFAAAPTAPSQLVATALSVSRIDLSWTDNASNETGFKVERSADGVAGWTQIATTAANVMTYSNTGLIVNTTYFYRVRAYNAIGNSSYTATASATTANAIPVAPTGLTATATSSSQITLAWADLPNENGYLIERSTSSTSGFTQIATTTANTVTFANTGLPTSTRYYYRIRATNSLGNSPYSSTVNATTQAHIPVAPSGFTATVLSNTQIRLNWTDNATDETSFKLERSPDGATWTQITAPAANVITYTNTGLTANTSYSYRIRAANASGNSAYSNTASATTNPPTPATPTNFAANAPTSSQIDLTWTDVQYESSYKVERSANGTSGWTQIGTTNPDVVTYADVALPTSTKYYYRLRASNVTGNSAYTAVVNATTLFALPADPTNPIATVASTTSVKIDWTDNANNETGFKIERSTNGTTWTQIATTVANVTTYTAGSLTTNTKYYFRVRAYNTSGNSNYTATVNATPK